MSDTFRPRSSYNPVAPIMKMRLENEIVRKREAEIRRIETARSNDRYFQHWSTQNDKYDEWTSPRSAQISARQYKLLNAESLVQERADRLKKLYHDEAQMYERELKGQQEEDEEKKWEQMRFQVQRFRQTKEMKFQEAAVKSDHDKWKHSSKAFKEFESELRVQQQKEMWDRQLKEKEEEKLRRAEEKQIEQQNMDRLKRQHQLEEERELKVERQKKLQWKNDLDQQIQEIKMKEAEAHAKMLEYERLVSEKMALEDAQEQIRCKEEDRAKRKRMGEYLTKQHLANLRIRSKEVASELEAEQRFADRIFPQNRDPACKEAVRQELDAYHKLLEKHRELEKERLKQMELMFQEEAKRMWNKREAEWEAERLSRKKLMEEVIIIQKRQLEEKMNYTNHERDLLLQERQDMLDSMEEYAAELKSRELMEQHKKQELRGQLAEQVHTRNQLRETEMTREREELNRAQQREKEWDERHWAVEMGRLKI